MKVFEVTTESYPEDSNEIRTQVEYVTTSDDSLKSVTDHYTTHCEQYEKELKGVREVLVIVQHIECSP